ncbi:MAG: hypothetical protein QOJ07_2069, partial [Thermoleophilaceae bacterium]|nr:hypothetical protein [Thermoleophilaceae bacterium]
MKSLARRGLPDSLTLTAVTIGALAAGARAVGASATGADATAGRFVLAAAIGGAGAGAVSI